MLRRQRLEPAKHVRRWRSPAAAIVGQPIAAEYAQWPPADAMSSISREPILRASTQQVKPEYGVMPCERSAFQGDFELDRDELIILGRPGSAEIEDVAAMWFFQIDIADDD